MTLARGTTDYYGALGVAPSATAAQIRQAFRLQLGILGARSTSSRGVSPELQLIQRAYQVLSDPVERERYDQTNGLAPRTGRRCVYRRRLNRLLDALAANRCCSANGRLADQTERALRRAG